MHFLFTLCKWGLGLLVAGLLFVFVAPPLLGFLTADWHSRNEVMTYIEEAFPGEAYTLESDYHTTGLLSREWKFRLHKFPNLQFVVDDCVKEYRFLPDFSPTGSGSSRLSLADNVNEIVRANVSDQFAASIPQKYGQEAQRIWKGFRQKGGDRWTWNYSPLYLEIQSYDEIDLAGRMLIDYLEQLKKTYPGEYIRPFFEIEMPLQQEVVYVCVQGKSYESGFTSIEFGKNSITWNSYYDDYNGGVHDFDQESVLAMQRLLLEYEAVYNMKIAGITDEMRKDFLRYRKAETRKQYETFYDGDYAALQIKGLPNLYATEVEPIYRYDRVYKDGTSEKVYSPQMLCLTRQAASNLFASLGLQVESLQSNYESFRVKGVDGKVYTFRSPEDYAEKSTDKPVHEYSEEEYLNRYYQYAVDEEKYYFKNNWSPLDRFPIDEELVQQISGINLRELVVQ